MIEILCGFLGNTYRVTGKGCLTTQLEAHNVRDVVQDAVADVLVRVPEFVNIV
jgi:hypothetical protein